MHRHLKFESEYKALNINEFDKEGVLRLKLQPNSCNELDEFNCQQEGYKSCKDKNNKDKNNKDKDGNYFFMISSFLCILILVYFFKFR